MDPRQERLEGAGELPGLEPVDPVKLVGPGDGVGGDVPLEAADVGRALRLDEARLAEREPGRRRPPLGDVEGGAHAADAPSRPVPRSGSMSTAYQRPGTR